jgi:hypothetical protein
MLKASIAIFSFILWLSLQGKNKYIINSIFNNMYCKNLSLNRRFNLLETGRHIYFNVNIPFEGIIKKKDRRVKIKMN